MNPDARNSGIRNLFLKVRDVDHVLTASLRRNNDKDLLSPSTTKLYQGLKENNTIPMLAFDNFTKLDIH